MEGSPACRRMTHGRAPTHTSMPSQACHHKHAITSVLPRSPWLQVSRACRFTGFWVEPPPGGEAPSVVDLVMSVRPCIHPKPYKKRLLADRALRPFSAAAAAPKLVQGVGFQPRFLGFMVSRVYVARVCGSHGSRFEPRFPGFVVSTFQGLWLLGSRVSRVHSWVL